MEGGVARSVYSHSELQAPPPDLDMLILPMFWKDGAHWLFAQVNMNARTIVIYDSMSSVSRWKAAYRVSLQHLELTRSEY